VRYRLFFYSGAIYIDLVVKENRDCNRPPNPWLIGFFIFASGNLEIKYLSLSILSGD
jgi:hypothetical protein